MSSFQLIPEIIALSRADTWEKAVKEWDVAGIEMLEPGEDSETCLCGHTPIREICHLYNKTTGRETIVGNVCVEKFCKDNSEAAKVFGSAKKAHAAGKRIVKDPGKSANPELIALAFKKKIITTKDRDFYAQIGQKRALTQKQIEYKESLNRAMVYGLFFTEKGAYLRLVKTPNGTAGPKLLERAHNIKVLNKVEYDFYMSVWNKSKLSDKQRDWKNRLNARIIRDLKGHYKPKT